MNNDNKKFRKRLLKLADKLDSLPNKRFDYTNWVGEDWQGKSDLSCGTTACALGWATTIPSFRKHGLRLIKGEEYTTSRVALVNDAGNVVGNDLAAAKELFGLDKSTYEFGIFLPDHVITINGIKLQSPDEHASAKKVAKHIRKFVVAKYGK